jgi:D-lactate dehydrogenase (cytochrome)
VREQHGCDELSFDAPLPSAVCSFQSIKAAVRTAMDVIPIRIPIARVELIYHNTVRMVNTDSKLSLRE